jgi:thiol-disulfide isomerase/thioredoxin
MRAATPVSALAVLALSACAARGPATGTRPVPGVPAASPIASSGSPGLDPRGTPEALPDLSLPDLAGRPRALSEFRGAPLLLDVWATWCDPCRHSLPEWDALATELGPRGLQVVAVNIDSADAPVDSFARRLAPNLLVLRDPGLSLPNALEVPVMPTLFVIDREGRIVGRHLGWNEGDSVKVKAQVEPLLAAEGAGSP